VRVVRVWLCGRGEVERDETRGQGKEGVGGGGSILLSDERGNGDVTAYLAGKRKANTVHALAVRWHQACQEESPGSDDEES
jgi:hypothetical protein